MLGGVYLLDTQIQVNDGSVKLEAEIEQRLKASLYELAEAIQQVSSHQVAQSKNEPVLATAVERDAKGGTPKYEQRQIT